MSLLLFTGQIIRIDDEGQSTAIYKQPVAGAIALGGEGLSGDAQADRRVHGGPEKAVHHYAAENYARLAARFPAIAAALLPGSIGENVSTLGWDERKVCIGDVFRLGSARVQVSQPRSPCWKIDHRYATPGMARHIAESGLTGWYYRVLETGEVAPGDAFALLDHPPGAIPLATLWQLWGEHRPPIERLLHAAEAPGLTPGWRRKLVDRAAWLQANGGAAEKPPTMFHVKPEPGGPA